MLTRAISILAVFFIQTIATAKVIPQNKLQNYKDAVLIQVTDGEIESCTTKSGTVPSSGLDLVKVITDATSGTLTENLTQPVLTFRAKGLEGEESRIVDVTTTTDFRKVVRLEGKVLVKDSINLGTIVEPIIREGIRTSFAFECKFRNN